METADQAIAALAQEVVADPALLDADTRGWLSEEAERGSSFWLEAGRYDTPGVLQSLAAVLGKVKGRHMPLSPRYSCTGCYRKRNFAAARFFDFLVPSGRLFPRAILCGTLAADGADDAADRIVTLIGNDTLKGGYVLGVLSSSSWLREVSEGKLVEVLQAIAAPNLENSGKVPRLLDFRSHIVAWRGGPLTELAWRCLEVHPTIGRQDDYHSDQIAGRLAPQIRIGHTHC